MSVISLVIAPLMEGDDDWEVWYYGLIPLGVMVLGTIAVYFMYWRETQDITADPVGKEDNGGKEEKDAEET